MTRLVPRRLAAILAIAGLAFLDPGSAKADPPPPDTVWFGGTTWDQVDGRWEAVADSVWTFDSGVGTSFDHTLPHVDPNKEPGLHALMEGWIGIDMRYGPKPVRWRLVDTADPRWDPAPCLSTLAGKAAWLGLFPAEADSLCWPGRQGFGNDWYWQLEKGYWHGTGSDTLSFDYDTDLGAIAHVLVVRASWEGTYRTVGLVTGPGPASGRETREFTPPDSTWVRLSFASRLQIDTDEDGGFDSSCGAMAVDNIVLSGSHDDVTDFESGWNGWSQVPSTPYRGFENGDWSRLAYLDDLEPVPGTGPCGVRDSVLCFADLVDPDPGHSMDQFNLALSPWIDLTAPGLSGDGVSRIELDYAIESIYHNYLYGWVGLEWFPDTTVVPGVPCSSPLRFWSPVLWIGDYGSYCSAEGTPRVADVSGLVPPQATRVRVAVGAVSINYLYDYYPSKHSSPWFDNVRLGILRSSAVSVPPVTPPPPPLQVFPNPVRGGGRVRFAGLAAADPPEVEVFDLSGRRVVRWRLDGEGGHAAVGRGGRPLAAGIYAIRRQTDGGTRTARILVLP